MKRIKILKTKIKGTEIEQIGAEVGKSYWVQPPKDLTKFKEGEEKTFRVNPVVLDDGFTYNAISLIEQGFAVRDDADDVPEIDWNKDIPKYDNYPRPEFVEEGEIIRHS